MSEKVKWPTYEDDLDLEGWLASVAVNECNDSDHDTFLRRDWHQEKESLAQTMTEYWELRPEGKAWKDDQRPFWLNRERLRDRRPRFIEHCGDIQRRMNSLILEAIKGLVVNGSDEAEFVEIPPSWKRFLGSGDLIFGARVIPGEGVKCNERIRVFSPEEQGRFFVLNQP